MRAFVTTLQKFFKMNTGNADTSANFLDDKRLLRIPMYQREYKWTKEKIHTLISDISKQKKFLGEIILDETSDCYEIADGQQRITTCYLILVYLYNYYSGSPLEQESILNIIVQNGNFILKNDTLGTYLEKTVDPVTHAQKIEYCISQADDIYSQQKAFDAAKDAIDAGLSDLFKAPEDVRDFKEKLLGSQVLVLINDAQAATSIEQIFLDINEKAQLLDIEDIFKGHCFEIYSPEFHQQLREMWVSLKKCATAFQKFGVNSFGDYIYLFLLEHDNHDLPKTLTPNGRHYLEGKTMDEVHALLQAMIQYGEHVLQFENDIDKTTYRFENLCCNARSYMNTNDHIALKEMSSQIIKPKKTIYQKTAFFYFIYRVTTEDTLRQEISYQDLRKIITNLYIYASLFRFSSDRKSKEDIDHTIRDATRETTNRVANLVSVAKELRIAKVETYQLDPKTSYDEQASIYSIMDNYNANENWLSLVYSRTAHYTPEHFMIPDQRTVQIQWYVGGEIPFKIQLARDFAKVNKTRTINFLIIPQELNGSLNNYDIIRKIEMIEEWYHTRYPSVPNHIQVFISHIQNMPEYCALQNCKVSKASKAQVEDAYRAFLIAYFSENNELELLRKLRERFKAAFQNHDNG